ncbi:MAG: SDR family oxidoreductase [Alphaproteobacteria bacterium]|nr:SDR family oxidoreductase [Alphaproteobacteria bacterium]
MPVDPDEPAPLAAKRNIRVNRVNPAPIDARMIHALEAGARARAPAAARNAMQASLPFKRYGTPAEVARLMRFLASVDASFRTVGRYLVDGGVMVGRIS